MTSFDGAQLNAALIQTAHRVNTELDNLITLPETSERRVFEAMRYSCLDGGKRLRPFLLLQSASLFGLNYDQAIRAACAIEMIHCYSLIHDDLPSMDNDDLRRGRPTCHRQFDEATALLAGDALLTQAFEILASEATHHDPTIRCHLITKLAHAAGASGMIGGQMVDLRAKEFTLDVAAITRLQQMKTGRLIEFSCEAGAILGRASPVQTQALRYYAHDIGLAFQIADDLLDTLGTAEEVGKQVGKDQDAGKATFVSLMGVDKAKATADMLANQACEHLKSFGSAAQLLMDTAHYIVLRRN